MDETRSRPISRTVAGIVAVTGIVGASFAVGRCSAPTAAAEPVIESTGTGTLNDAETAIAIALDGYLATVTTTTTAPPAAVVRAPRAEPATAGADRWDRLAQCESGGRWDYPPVAGGFSGGIMFHVGTWRAMGGEEFAPDAWQATRDQQIVVAERVLAVSGWGAWPGCSTALGWR